ncbi:MAG: dTDP-4-dehydrorhamnose reductase [Comamonadaceae bacterium]|nr:MAG: dTDP-4-dehydrorhamnose reductase [Comamonadaceae bacterium]
MKILLFGSNGQVGWELQRSLAPLGELVMPEKGGEALCGDLTDLEGLVRTVRKVAPTVIVNAAAYTAVDRAESEPELCSTVNSMAPGILAAEADRLGAWMVHYSTDYVFDGSGERPWIESDPMAPLGVYGQTKAQGETRIAAACDRHLILRTSWVYADRGSNFLLTMLRLLQERESLSVVDDQYGAPTGAELVADVTAHVLRAAVLGKGPAGLYHLVPGGQTTWFGYAQYLLACAQAMGMPVKGVLGAVATSAYPTAARRPHNSRLDNKKLESAFGLQLPPWQQGVRRVLANVAGRALLWPERVNPI